MADVGELRAGESFHLGVLFEPDEGWHVYWRNPGEAGLATDVVYDLPEGFEVGELQWPAPISFEQSDGIIGYGYENSVVLGSEVTVPAGLTTPIVVTIHASWLACKDVCILGSAVLKADLPLRGDELKASRAVFKGWPETLSVPAESGLYQVSVTGGPVAESGSTDLVVWLNWREAPGPIEFFPDPGPGVKVEGVRSQTRGTLTRIDLTISRLKTSSAPAKSLRAVIVTNDADGSRHAKVSHIDID